MQEIKPPANSPKDEFEFEVMPRPERPERVVTKSLPREERPKIFKWLWLLVLMVVLLGTGYWWFAQNRQSLTTKFRKTPADIVIDNDEQADDQDRDGLTAEEENKHGTNPSRSDTDGDGLADGDEVNIYKSDPLLPDTDNDSFDDGREAARGFSPIVNSPDKASADELKKWDELITQFGLHEPTKTTLRLKADSNELEQTLPYTNSRLGYSLLLPNLLSYREQEGEQQVGFYILGTTPEDPDVLTDPISISTAVITSGQEVSAWIRDQYQAAATQTTIGETLAFRLNDFDNEVCKSNLVFLPKDNTIIILTWKCNDQAAFGTLYDQLLQSFKWQ